MKYTPSHQLEVSIINLASELDIWPPRKTLVNIPNQIQVQQATIPNIANPKKRSPGLADRILEANSKIPIALFNEYLPL